MRTRVLTTLLMLWLLSGGVFAQADHPAVPPLTDIFAPNVVIEYREANNSPATAYPIDSDRRVFFDGEKEVAFPPDFDIFYVFKIDDARLGVKRRTGEFRSDFYVYEHETGLFSLFESPCVPDSNRYGFWETEFTTQPWSLSIPKDGQAFFCNRLTGERSAPLPEEYEYIFPGDFRENDPLFEASPNGEFIAFWGLYITPEDRWRLVLLSYEVVTGEIRLLGDTEYLSYQSFSHWVDNLVFVSLSSYTGSAGGYSVSIADVSQPDSLASAFGYSSQTPMEFVDNPPRFIVKEACGERVIYDVTTRSEPRLTYMPLPTIEGEPTRIPLDREYQVCNSDYVSESGLSYYRGVTLRQITECCGAPPIDGAEAALIQDRNILYTSEIEQIWWVSDDQRLVLLTLDADGEIDNNPFDEYFLSGWMEHPEVTLIDLTTGEVLATNPYFAPYKRENRQPRHFNKLMGDIFPLSQNEVLINWRDEIETQSHILSSENGELVEKVSDLLCPLGLTDDRGYLITGHYVDRLTKCWGSHIDMLNLETGALIPLIVEPLADVTIAYELISSQSLTDLAPNPISTDSWHLRVYHVSENGNRTKLAEHSFSLTIREDGTPVVTLHRN